MNQYNTVQYDIGLGKLAICKQAASPSRRAAREALTARSLTLAPGSHLYTYIYIYICMHIYIYICVYIYI